MTAAYRTADATTGVTTPTGFTIPAIAAAGDVMYVAYLVAGLETATIPVGFTQLDTPRQDSGDTWVLVRKVLEAGDLGAAKSFSYTDAAFPHSGVIWAIVSGADTTTPEDATPVWTGPGSGTAHAITGITTATDGAYVMTLFMERVATANASFSTSAGTIRKSAISTGSVAVEGCMVDHGTVTPGSGRGATTVTANSVASTHSGGWAIAVKPLLSTQVVGLTADVTVTGWTAVPSGATNLVDRTSDDSDTTYVESSANPSDLLFRGSVSGAISGPPARVRVRCEVAAGAAAGSVTIQLIEVDDGDDTVIAERTETGVDGSWADYMLTLTGDEMEAIGDYTNLDVALTCSVTG